MTGRTLAGILTAALALSAGGCSAESTPTDTGGPSGNPVLLICSVNGVPTPPDGMCIEVPDGADPTIEIQVSTATTCMPTSTTVLTLDLRPPGYCAVVEEVGCGHLIARVNGAENSESATRMVLVHLGKLANRYADLTIAIEAVDDLGKPILANGDAGTQAPLIRTVRVTTSKSCPDAGTPSDAGAEGG